LKEQNKKFCAFVGVVTNNNIQCFLLVITPKVAKKKNMPIKILVITLIPLNPIEL